MIDDLKLFEGLINVHKWSINRSKLHFYITDALVDLILFRLKAC